VLGFSPEVSFAKEIGATRSVPDTSATELAELSSFTHLFQELVE
jgi:hypothetical protein